MDNKIVLEMERVSKSFGATQALKDVHFQLRLGEIHALLGENGAGKSTLIKVLGGIHQPDQGIIKIDGKEVRISGIHEAQAAGIGIIHQEIMMVPHLTVTENIFLGRELMTRMHTRNLKQMNVEAEGMVEKLGLNIDVTKPVGELSIAQQQMVEIVKAISFNIKILVMDEPTSSLSDEEVGKLFEMMRRLKEQRVSIIYISHRMEELFAMTDRITVMRDGTYVDTVETAATDVDKLVGMMVGRNLTNYYTRTYNKLKQEILKVENLSKAGVFENISFSVRQGEILGFSGLVGAGRSEIMQAVFGNEAYDSGTIYIAGEKVCFRDSAQAIEKGLAMVPEDRKKQGLTLINSVGFNMTLASLGKVMNGPFLSEGKRNQVIGTYMHELNVKAASKDISVSSLSGGNQQKVVLAKWLATKPAVLILDEPTRGVDVGAKAEIYAIINRLAQEGMAIIMISSELPEIINMCDNVCVVREGRIVGRLSQRELEQEAIMKYATGGQ